MAKIGDVGLGFGTGEAGAAPNAPSITCTAGTNQVTVTIDGDDSVTNYVLYKKPADSDWTAGGNRSGDGDVVVSSLDNDVPYTFCAYSRNAEGLNSLPSATETVTLSAVSVCEFDSEIADSADDFIDLFGESVTYKPAGGGSRAIVAIVDREGHAALEGIEGNAPVSLVTVQNDVTSGITPSEVDTGGDMITMAHVKGETAVDRPIVEIMSQDAGMMTLMVR